MGAFLSLSDNLILVSSIMSIGQSILTFSSFQIRDFSHFCAQLLVTLYWTKAISDNVKNPWAKPSGIHNWLKLSPDKVAEIHLPKVGESFLRSTATSKISPDIHLTNFDWG